MEFIVDYPHGGVRTVTVVSLFPTVTTCGGIIGPIPPRRSTHSRQYGIAVADGFKTWMKFLDLCCVAWWYALYIRVFTELQSRVFYSFFHEEVHRPEWEQEEKEGGAENQERGVCRPLVSMKGRQECRLERNREGRRQSRSGVGGGVIRKVAPGYDRMGHRVMVVLIMTGYSASTTVVPPPPPPPLRGQWSNDYGNARLRVHPPPRRLSFVVGCFLCVPLGWCGCAWGNSADRRRGRVFG